MRAKSNLLRVETEQFVQTTKRGITEIALPVTTTRGSNRAAASLAAHDARGSSGVPAPSLAQRRTAAVTPLPVAPAPRRDAPAGSSAASLTGRHRSFLLDTAPRRGRGQRCSIGAAAGGVGKLLLSRTQYAHLNLTLDSLAFQKLVIPNVQIVFGAG